MHPGRRDRPPKPTQLTEVKEALIPAQEGTSHPRASGSPTHTGLETQGGGGGWRGDSTTDGQEKAISGMPGQALSSP